MPSHDDHDRFRMRLERGPQQLHPLHLGHVQVEQHDVEAGPLERLERLVAATAHPHVVTLVLEHAGAAFPQGALVVHDEDLDARLGGGGERERVGYAEWLGGAVGAGAGRIGRGSGGAHRSRFHRTSLQRSPARGR